MDPQNKTGAAAAIGFIVGWPLALASMFWGLNLLPVLIAVPALIGCLALPFVMSWLFYWGALNAPPARPAAHTLGQAHRRARRA